MTLCYFTAQRADGRYGVYFGVWTRDKREAHEVAHYALYRDALDHCVRLDDARTQRLSTILTEVIK